MRLFLSIRLRVALFLRIRLVNGICLPNVAFAGRLGLFPADQAFSVCRGPVSASEAVGGRPKGTGGVLRFVGAVGGANVVAGGEAWAILWS